MRRFSAFACLDWSGAKGERQKGIALAIAKAGVEAPALVPCEGGWSREKVLAWLREQFEAGVDIVIGIDFSPSLPFEDAGAFFPGWHRSPPDARSLWALVDEIAIDDPHLAANLFVDHPLASSYFRRSHGRKGDRFGDSIGRMRVVERLAAANPASCFNLVGAKQVGKSSLTGMRVLHRLCGAIPVWPFDDIPDQGPLIVEIYTSIAAFAADVPRNRAKIRDQISLDAALAALKSKAHPGLARYDDHSTDAIVTAAWLRAVAGDAALWNPAGLTEPLRRTEGWTFGVA